MYRTIEADLLLPSQVEPFLEATSRFNPLESTKVYTSYELGDACVYYADYPRFGENLDIAADPDFWLREDCDELLTPVDPEAFDLRQAAREKFAQEALDDSKGRVVGVVDVGGLTLNGLVRRYNRVMREAELGHQYDPASVNLARIGRRIARI